MKSTSEGETSRIRYQNGMRLCLRVTASEICNNPSEQSENSLVTSLHETEVRSYLQQPRATFLNPS